jgi:hypothetical protein
MMTAGFSDLFSRPLHGLGPMFAALPAINRWAISGRPLTRTRAAIFVQAQSEESFEFLPLRPLW